MKKKKRDLPIKFGPKERKKEDKKIFSRAPPFLTALLFLSDLSPFLAYIFPHPKKEEEEEDTRQKTTTKASLVRLSFKNNNNNKTRRMSSSSSSVAARGGVASVKVRISLSLFFF